MSSDDHTGHREGKSTFTGQRQTQAQDWTTDSRSLLLFLCMFMQHNLHMCCRGYQWPEQYLTSEEDTDVDGWDVKGFFSRNSYTC